MQIKRPFTFTILAIGLLILAVEGLLRTWQAIELWELLTHTLLSRDPLYLVISGIIQALIGLILALGVWFGWRWSWWGTLYITVLGTIYVWIDRLFIAELSNPQRYPFYIMLSIIVVAYVAWVLFHPTGKKYFHQGKPKQEEIW
jgi:hypothetical protein